MFVFAGIGYEGSAEDIWRYTHPALFFPRLFPHRC